MITQGSHDLTSTKESATAELLSWAATKGAFSISTGWGLDRAMAAAKSAFVPTG